MIGTSRSELYFIQACIYFLHYIAPACVAYCVLLVFLYGIKATTYRFPLFIETLAFAETAFYLLVFTPYRIYLQREAAHPPQLGRAERRALFTKCNDSIPDVEAYLRKWFLGAPIEEIKKDNVKEFFLWAFFNRGGLPGKDDDELEEYIAYTENSMGRKVAPGRGTAQSLRLTLDKVDMLHRSLTWYFCVGFVDFLTFVQLRLHGFNFHRTPLSKFFTLFPFRPVSLLTKHKSPSRYLSYWHRPHTSSTKLPIVFIHGIGIGLYPYTKFLNELNSRVGVETSNEDDQVGIIALEIMPVSFRLTHAALDKKTMCEEINRIVSAHFGAGQQFVLLTHSYGTVIATHLLKTPSTADRINSVVLIDPVSILLHLPDVAYNFTRRKPKNANELQLHYFASMDMGVSHTLGRHFFWSDNILWKEDIVGKKVTVSLAGRDLIVNTEAVRRYLEGDSYNGHDKRRVTTTNDGSANVNGTSHGSAVVHRNQKSTRHDRMQDDPNVNVVWWSDLDHAQVFDKPSTRKRLLDIIRMYCESI